MGTKAVLQAELDQIAERLQAGDRIPSANLAAADFLDLAQDIEHQEMARLSLTRLSERAKRLHLALSRVSTGEYGVCSECQAAIPPRRLHAIPDVSTCVACQERLELTTH